MIRQSPSARLKKRGFFLPITPLDESVTSLPERVRPKAAGNQGELFLCQDLRKTPVLVPPRPSYRSVKDLWSDISPRGDLFAVLFRLILVYIRKEN